MSHKQFLEEVTADELFTNLYISGQMQKQQERLNKYG